MRSILVEYPHQDPGITYFDSAGRSVLPRSVEDVGITAVMEKSQPWKGVGSDADIVTVRKTFAQLIGSTNEHCIALNPSTGFAMTMVAENLVRTKKISSDKVVVLLDKEMGSAVYPWQEACKESGAKMRVVTDPLLTGSELSWTDAVLSSIDEHVAVVALPNVHWCNGAVIDLKRISERLAQIPEEVRPIFVIDGTQSLGALPFDLSEIHADVVACSVHKWLNSPYGMSLVYINPKYHSMWLPLDHHERGRLGSNQEGWDEIIYMDPVTGFYPEPLFADARRFDAGGKANPVTVPMVRAGLQTVFKWSPSAVQEHCASLTDSLVDQLRNLFGDDIIIRQKSQRSAHILGVRFSPRSSYYSSLSLIELNAELKKENVYASVRGEWLRLAVYLHNSLANVNRFVSLFVQITQKLCFRHSLASSVISSETSPKRILITGSAGWLSQFVLHSLLRRTICTASYSDTCEIFAAYSSVVPHWVPVSHRVHLDLSNNEEIRAVIEHIRPDIIVHTAALSSPVVCHKDERRAYAVNCPNALIQAVKNVNPDCLFVFTSTDMVYDGESPPYLATTTCDGSEPPRPVNVYGATKLSFEKEVQTLKHGVVLRLSNMIGAPYKYMPAGVKFLEWVNGAFARREFVGLKEREIRSFVFVEDVVAVVEKLICRYLGARRDGSWISTPVLNVGGPVPLSRLAVAHSLCTALGAELVIRDKSDPSQHSLPVLDATAAAREPIQSWEVYVLDAHQSNNSATQGELRSPCDISMDSSLTETLLGIKFTFVEDVLAKCMIVY